MLYTRKGMPEVDEIVLCKVTKIFPSSVFVDIPAYEKGGIVHISEVSPGRIRNLRDYVSIGRQIVCKVLRVDREKDHIDLSLRRVNSTQRKEKLDEVKQELKAEQIIKNLAKKLNQPVEKLYEEISKKIFPEYSHLHLCFHAVAEGEADLAGLGVNKKLAAELTSVIEEKFRPTKVYIKGEITLQTYHSDGVEKIKAVLTAVETSSPTITLFYLGAGRYKLVIEDEDYKEAENTLKNIQELVAGFNDKLSTATLEREKGVEKKE